MNQKPDSTISDVLSSLSKKYPEQKEYLQAASEVLHSLGPVMAARPEYRAHRVLQRLVEPERIFMFRVPWRDDRGTIQVNTGFRIGFNSALGPYKGGLRFHPSVNLSILKFLGFEQIFKNALTGLPLGGGKGGSDFDPRGRSEAEVERFCQSFMLGLFPHIGAETDVPAGDIGVGAREIGFMFGQYKRIVNRFDGVLTGKGVEWGGSYVRPEATGFGATYFAQEMLKTRSEDVAGKTVCISGFGNVAWGVAKKVTELGGRVVTLSGPDGFVHDPAGVSGEKIDYMLTMRASSHDRVEDYAKQFKVDFHAGKRAWSVPCQIAFPCACENELDEEDARQLLKNGCTCLVEGANMPVTPKALEVVQEAKILYAPGKASNAGGVACSGLEMIQNSTKRRWPREEVDRELHRVMVDIHRRCMEAGEEFGIPGNYMAGANIAGFLRVANAMIDQGAV